MAHLLFTFVVIVQLSRERPSSMIYSEPRLMGVRDGDLWW